MPTRYFLGRPDVGEEMHISIEQGKTLIIRLMAVGPVIEGRAQRDVWFEVNGEVRAVSVEDKNSAVETVSREKATNDPGSVGAPMSGVVVEVRVVRGDRVLLAVLRVGGRGALRERNDNSASTIEVGE